jgi:hypothetical protein
MSTRDGQLDRTTAGTYLTGVGDQLAAAVARGDHEAAEQIVDRVDADGHRAAAVHLGRALDATSLHIPPSKLVSIDTVIADGVRVTTDRLVAVSRWVDTSPANAARDPEALTWVRCAKVGEEAGEVVDALNRATGANPRKGATGSYAEVSKELLDVAFTALAAYEHLNGHHGASMAAFFSHVAAVHTRAGLTDADGTA